MRLRILSDLHLEHFDGSRELPDVEADAVVLAGDIHRHTRGLEWAAERFPDTPVLYVPGNHEFYGTCMSALRAELADTAQRLGIHLLDNTAVTLGGVRFLGTTLWTDFALYAGEPEHDPTLGLIEAQLLMADFRLIEQPADEVFTPRASQALHREARAWLETELAAHDATPRVVISHHAPLPDCVPLRYRGDPLSAAFASNLAALMGRMRLWIHGHVHDPVDLERSGTRVLANPGGYPGEHEPPLFVADQVIEIQA
ncbi:metallophosphoesterase [Halomonas sp. NO4]|uniref:metallophosphoesterase n=1 Tax=Halomonas sp. NO4 TaxID=2484813 RepID=UPI0013D0A8F3|nr:metallophosphoesterase [Halomonas sp. NO4]